MTSRVPGPQPGDPLRRLRAWGVSSWRHGDRISRTRTALDRLAALADVSDGIPRPVVPDAGVHALADQLDVLVDDALSSGAPEADVAEIVADLAAGLGLTRS